MFFFKSRKIAEQMVLCRQMLKCMGSHFEILINANYATANNIAIHVFRCFYVMRFSVAPDLWELSS